ncbi:uncharacterized protein LOC116162042 [Photinus pyralis]|uniref:uncharacterized protein LOC116162042 n=1 Tax=Photinus pyralis TaxID=7054 RepID=UPI00126749EA|nr:uncharacterized protein LOC116162042 [Photinus pyralis]
MADTVELEICANCKREIPPCNYVMHTAHCARNITLCDTCEQPIPKNEFQQHAKTCMPEVKPVVIPLTKIEQSPYFAARKEIEDKKSQQRRKRRLERLERFTNIGETAGHSKVKEPPAKQPRREVYSRGRTAKLSC